MQTPDYSIGVVTYLGRYETYFQPFMRELAAIFPDREIVIFVNGHYDILQQTAYLKEVTAFLATFRNVRYVTNLEHQSLARGWNHLVWMARHPRVLICNDDLRIDPVFRQHMERGLAEYPDFFVINRSWSHFIMAKEVIRQVGWFDERFKGVGYEDGDYMVRMIAAKRPLVSIPCAGVKNIVANQANAGWANQSKVTRGKYSLMNEEFFRLKYASNFTGREERADDVYAIRFPWNGEILKATLRKDMETPLFYPFNILNDGPAAQAQVTTVSPMAATLSERPAGKPLKSPLPGGTLEITTVIGCRIACNHCPQSALVRNYAAKGEARVMSFDTFKQCIDKVPADVRIVFCGMAEPWLNPDCTRMLQYAVAQGHELDVFSTLAGMKMSDWEAIKGLEFNGFVVHVADALNNAKIPITPDYVDLLTEVMATKVNVKDKSRYKISSHGPVHPKIASIVGNRLPIDSALMDRAGNLNNEGLTHCQHDGPLQCGSAGRALNLNVLLPDGTVLLCCMDYAMKHILGNLLEIDYAGLFTSEEARRVLAGMDDGGIPLLCRTCPVAQRYQEPQHHPARPVPVELSTRTLSAAATKPRIVGMVVARTEAPRLAFCLRALALYTDAIVYLDDCSEDDSVKIAESLATECRVERILRKDRWHRDEPGDRNLMLRVAREIGGTHFIALDADEAFTSNCADNDFLRRMILALQPGDQTAVNWIQLWRDVGQYRLDDSIWTWNYKGVIFCDDGQCSYNSEFIHTPRAPANLSGQTYRLSGYVHGLMHFQFVNWRNLLVKQAWYRCLERVRDPQKPVTAINERYAPSMDERGLRLQLAPPEWLSGYPFFDAASLNESEWWREKQIRQWFKQHRQSYFKDLDIWDLDWSVTPASIRQTVEMPAATQDDLTAQAVALVGQAEQCQARGDLHGARIVLTKALHWAPNVVDLILATAAVNLQLGDARTARWLAVQATQLQPGHPTAFVRLAEATLALDLQTECDSALARAMELSPSDPAVLAVLGNTKLAREEFADAILCFRQVLEQTPADIPTLLRLGMCHFKTGAHESARQTYAEILRVEPGHKMARENFAFLSRQADPEPVLAAGQSAS